ncbi:MAG: tyrosine-type recombinase/integrase [Pseudonocardiaceae bacterium]
MRDYAGAWLASQTFDESTREAITVRLRNHINPHLGHLQLAEVTPEHIRNWVKKLHDHPLAANYRAVLFTHVSTILNAAVADGRIRHNPCQARSVTRPRAPAHKITPWSRQRIHAVHTTLPDRYKITLTLGAGCGLRQGEVFGLADTDITGTELAINRQIKIVRGVLCFGPPKGGRTRRVPLPANVLHAVRSHQQRYPTAPVSLPWRHPRGRHLTAHLMVTRPNGRALHRSTFNTAIWGKALTKAGIIRQPRVDGFHALRHFYASALLDAGESITALAEHLGHSDPAFTLRVYTHLMPTSHQRTCEIINQLFPTHRNGTPTA